MSVFETLRAQKKEIDLSRSMASSSKEDLLIQILFDEQGAYLLTINNKGVEIQPSHTQFSGANSQLIKAISSIQDKNAFIIDWENPTQRVYLKDHPYLMDSIVKSDLLVDRALKPIISAVNAEEQATTRLIEAAQIRLSITPELSSAKKTTGLSSPDRYKARLSLQNTDKSLQQGFQFLTDSYVLLLDQNKIIQIQPTGHPFSQIKVFDDQIINEQDLPQYLSLLYTYIDQVSLQFPPYKIIRAEQPIQARPALIFEKIDQQQNLIIRIGQALPDTPIGFLDDYEVTQLATINELEQVITITPIALADLSYYAEKIFTSLKKHLPRGKKRAAELYTIDGQHIHLHEQVASPFIYQELASLLLDFEFIGSEKLQAFKVKVGMPKLSLSLGHDINFLEGSAYLDFDGEKINLMDAIQQFDKHRYIRLTDGSNALINEAYINRLKRLFKKSKHNKTAISFSLFDLPAIEELIQDEHKSPLFTHAREIFEGFNTIGQHPSPLPMVNANLRSYQVQGYQWMRYLQQHQLGGCLADDMGLGKTLQTICILAAAYSAPTEAPASAQPQKRATKKKAVEPAMATAAALPPSIIIMPRSLLYNWQNEIKKFAPGLSYYVYYGQNRDIEAAMQKQVILTTYSSFRNEIKLFKQQSFYYGILDESQSIKNMQSQTHKAVIQLSAKHRLALSGTPIENNLMELYALFSFLNPSLLGSTDQFNYDYLIPIQKYSDKEAARILKQKIYPFILRRLKKDVLTELPDKQEQTIYVDMNPDHAKLYEKRRLYYKNAVDEQVAAKGIKGSQFFIFQAMNELRQIASIPEAKSEGRTSSSKLEALMEQVTEAVANDHKILIFVNYLAAIESIGEALDNIGIDFLAMTGSTKDRQGLVDRFQTDPDIKVFIMTLKTGGTGLNLTAADMVFIFDPWWNKAAENQAVDRAHRMGQQSKVQSYKMITLGTIEEKILQLQEFKSGLIDELISTDVGADSIKSISKEDIEFILG